MRHLSPLTLCAAGAAALLASSCRDDYLYAARVDPGDAAPTTTFDAAAADADESALPDATHDAEPDPATEPAAPCLDISPEAIDFGGVLRGEQLSRTAYLFNCGAEALPIFRVEPTLNTVVLGYDTPTHVDFAVDVPGSQMDADGTLTPAAVIAPNGALLVEITFSPEAARYRLGAVFIHSSTTRAPRELSFSGEGQPPNRCPTARIVGELRDDAGSDSGLNAVVGQTVVLDGTSSSDIEGEVASWAWTLGSQPEASTAALLPVNNEPPAPSRRELSIDQAGLYTINLVVVDDEGLSSCAPASFWIQASERP